MNCASCGHENPDSARFCLECGTPFALRCAGCGAELPAGAKFCLECGAAVVGAASERAALAAARHSPRAPTSRHLADKILQSKSALEGERKQVTVLFADVKGSMELAEQLDPEEWHRSCSASSPSSPRASSASKASSTSSPATASWRSSARRSRTRITRSGRATRRCTCATRSPATHRGEASARPQLLDAHGPPLRRGGGRQDRRRSTHGLHGAGTHVGLAQRMEALASPDTCYSRARRRRSSRGYFNLEDLGEFPVKGVARAGTGPPSGRRGRGCAPASTVARPRPHALRRPRRRHGDARGGAGARRAGHGQVVGVVAEAGTGKSRLCFEFAERCRAAA